MRHARAADTRLLRTSARAGAAALGRAAVLTIGLALAATSLWPSGRAVAGALRCASRALTVRDFVGAREAASRALRGLAPLAADLPGVCRNPMDASASFQSIRRASSDGVTQWWSVACARDTAEWACRPPELLREFELDAPMAGRTLHAIVALSAKSDLDLARILVPRAIAYLGTRTPVAGKCETVAADAPATDDGVARAAKFASQGPLRIDVRDDNTIDLGYPVFPGWGLEFTPARAPPEEQQICAMDVVVVA